MGMIENLKGLFLKKKRLPTEEENDVSVHRIDKRSGLSSGGHIRDDKLVQVGWASTQGRRFYNEDTIYCNFRPIPGGKKEETTHQVTCLGVFDGHGGAAAAKYVRDHIFDILLANPKFNEDLFHAVEEAFVDTDRAYLEEDAKAKNDDGCTGTVAVVVGKRLVVAHVGDSRAIMSDSGYAVPLTEDHKPNRPDERERIEGIGGTVIHAGTWRVGGVLAVSRGFGNRYMKTYIVAKPQIREDILHDNSQCLIIASDGVWDLVSNEEAVEHVSSFGDAEAAARALVALAYDRGSYDNISCIVAKFAFAPGEGHFPKTSRQAKENAAQTTDPQAKDAEEDEDEVRNILLREPVRVLDTAYRHISSAATGIPQQITAVAGKFIPSERGGKKKDAS